MTRSNSPSDRNVNDSGVLCEDIVKEMFAQTYLQSIELLSAAPSFFLYEGRRYGEVPLCKVQSPDVTESSLTLEIQGYPGAKEKCP